RGGTGGQWFARSCVPGQTESGELPSCLGRKEVAVTDAVVTPRRQTGGATQDVLAVHELAVILAQRAGRRAVAGVAHVRAGRPLPQLTGPLFPAESGM